MSLDLIKEYLKIDFDDDDRILEMLLDSARRYVRDAVGYQPDESDERVKLLLLVLISDWYEHRKYMEISNTKSISQKVRYTIHSIVLQLQYSEAESNENQY
ncbi:MAG: head-tail connector protein [Ruminococcus sp.]|nr:head-tail connector protein [Ruminococcus sp.]